MREIQDSGGVRNADEILEMHIANIRSRTFAL